VAAYTKDSTVKAHKGNVKVNARATDVIDAQAWAGSVAIAAFSGVALAGAGVEVTNQLSSSVQAYLENANVTATVGNIEVTAVSDSWIKKPTATGVAVAASLSKEGVAVSVAASIVDNVIRNTVEAYAKGSAAYSIRAGGHIEITADAENARITETSATTAAVSGGLIGASGGGVDISNLIDNTVEASVSGPITLVADSDENQLGNVSITADENAFVEAESVGLTASISVASAAVGVSIVENRISSSINASVKDATVRAADITVDATSVANIAETLSLVVAGAAVGIGSNEADARIDTTVEALVEDADVTASGHVWVKADSDADANAEGNGATLGNFGVGVVDTEAVIGEKGKTTASLGGTVSAGKLTVEADDDADADADTWAAAGGIGLAVGVNTSTAEVERTVTAKIADKSIVTVAGDVKVKADAAITGSADTFGVSAGTIAVGSSEAEVILQPTVKSSVGKDAIVSADGKVTIDATLSKNDGTAKSRGSSGSFVGFTYTGAYQDVTVDVTAAVGRGATITGATGIDVRSKAATNLTKTLADVSAVSGLAGQDARAVESIHTAARTEVGENTELDEGATLIAAFGVINLTSQNSVSTKPTADTFFAGGGGGSVARADTTIRGKDGGSSPLAEVVLGRKSDIRADVLHVEAKVTKLDVDSRTIADQYALGGLAITKSVVDVISEASIEQRDGARISANTVTLTSSHDGLDIFSFGDSEGFGLLALHDGTVDDRVSMRSTISVDEGAELRGNTITVLADAAGSGHKIRQQNNDELLAIPERESFIIDVNADAEIDIDGLVVPGAKHALLLVNADGTIGKQRFVDATEGSEVLVNKLNHASGGTLTVTAQSEDVDVRSYSTAGAGPRGWELDEEIFKGDSDVDQPFDNDSSSEVNFDVGNGLRSPQRFDSVTVTNRSGLDLQVLDLNVMFPPEPVEPEITINGKQDEPPRETEANLNATPVEITQSGNSGDILINGTINNPSDSTEITAENDGNILINGAINNPSGPTEITAENDGDILINGTINNPSGSSVISTKGGSLMHSSGAAPIVTAQLDLSAPGGAIGNGGIPVKATIDKGDSSDPASLEGVADGVINIKLTPFASAQTIDVPGLVSENSQVLLNFGGNDMRLTGPISAAKNSVRITDVNDIRDAHVDPYDITAVSLFVSGTGDIGEDGNPLETDLSSIEVKTSGGIYVKNARELDVEGAGLEAGKAIILEADGAIDINAAVDGGAQIVLTSNASGASSLGGFGAFFVDANVTGEGEVTLLALDTAADNDAVILANGVTIKSVHGDLTLLSGDDFEVNATHQLIAGGTGGLANPTGKLTIGIDQGNVDGGTGASFGVRQATGRFAGQLTVPTQASGIIQAGELYIVGENDADTIIIPDLFLPTTFEAAGGFDTVDATLPRDPSQQTSLLNIDVEKIDFLHENGPSGPGGPFDWVLDTDPTTKPQVLWVGGSITVDTVHLSEGGNIIVENVHSNLGAFESLDSHYIFSDANDDISILELQQPTRIELGGGTHHATVGGTRTSTSTGPLSEPRPVDPGRVVQPLMLIAGDGDDTFELRDDRDSDNVVPVGRIGVSDSATGLVSGYGSSRFTDGTVKLSVTANAAVFTIDANQANPFQGGERIEVETVAFFDVGDTVEPGDSLFVVNVDGQTFQLSASRGANPFLPADGTGTFSFQQAARQVIEFQQFEDVVVNLGATDAIFTVDDTLLPTVINAGAGDDVINIRKLTAAATLNLDTEPNLAADQAPGDDTVNIQGGGALLTINGGGEDKSLDLPDGGDRIILGSTRSFDGNVINVLDAPNAIKLSGTGWEKGQQLLFTTDGSAPAGLADGRLYYAVPFGRDIIRLADTREEALAANPRDENDPNIIELGNGGQGEHQLTLTVNGQPQWPAMDVSLTGDNSQAQLLYNQPFTTGQNNTATFVDIEKLNLLGGLGDDRMQIDHSITGLDIELRGGPGDDEFRLFSLGAEGVIRGDSGTDDSIGVVVQGNPIPDQFAGLQVSAGIERLTVDNDDNQERVDWIVSQGTLYFVDGEAADVAVDTGNGTFSSANFIPKDPNNPLSKGPLSDGDRILLSAAPVSVATEPQKLVAGELPGPLDASQIYVVRNLVGTSFQLATSADPADAVLTPDSPGTGALSFRRVATLASLEGAERSEILGGTDANDMATDTLTVLSPVSTTIDITENEVRIIDGSLVLEHEDNLVRDSFPVPRVDGLLGVRSVAATQNHPFVFAAGTAEDKIAMFVRTLSDPENPASDSLLKWVGAIDSATGHVPESPSKLVLSPNENYLYVVGSNSIAYYQVTNDEGKPKLIHGGTLFGDATIAPPNRPIDIRGLDSARINPIFLPGEAIDFAPTDLVFLSSTQLAVTSQGADDGIFIFARVPEEDGVDQIAGLDQKLRRENSFGTSIDVGNEVAPRGSQDVVADIIVLDQPLYGAIDKDGVYRFYSSNRAGHEITPLLLRATTEDDHTGPNDLKFEIVAVGRARTVVDGWNEFEFATSDPVPREAGLYFGWRGDPRFTGPLVDNDGTVVGQLLTGGVVDFDFGASSSNAFILNSTSTEKGIERSAGFLPSRAYSMEATFKVAEVPPSDNGKIGGISGEAFGLNDPQSIANDGANRLFTGDAAGDIATWVKDPFYDTFRLVTKEEFSEAGKLGGTGGAGFGEGVELSFSDDGSYRASATQAASEYGVTSAGDTVYRAEKGKITWSNATTGRSGSLSIPPTVHVNRGEFASTTFDIDLDGAAIASNGQFVFVGAPGSDRVVAVEEGDDTGAVLVYRVKTNGSLELYQVLAASSNIALKDNVGFGSAIAVDGNRMLIGSAPNTDVFGNLGNGSVQVWEYGGGVWTRRPPEFSGYVFDVDRDTVIIGQHRGYLSTSSDAVSIYRKTGSGAWSQAWTNRASIFSSGPFPSEAVAVTIDGNTASYTDRNGVVHVLRETATFGWTEIDSVSIGSGVPLPTRSIAENNTGPFLTEVRITHIGFFDANGTAGTEINDEEGYIRLNGRTIFNRSYNTLDDDDEWHSTGMSWYPWKVSAGGNFIVADELKFSFRERDGDTSEYLGKITFENDGFQTEGSRVGNAFSYVDGKLAMEFQQDLFVVPKTRTLSDDDTVTLVSDISDSLSDVIAVGIPGQDSVFAIAESARQDDFFNGGDGRITGLAFRDGALYATHTKESEDNSGVYVDGKVYVLNGFGGGPLALNALDTEDEENLVGASSVSVSVDGSKAYVTAESADEVTVYTRNADNTLTRLTGESFPAVKGLDGAADSATEPTFGAQQFLVTAGAGADALVTFELITDAQGTALGGRSGAYDQGPNEFGENGLGDGDPLESITRAQALVANPVGGSVEGVEQTFYMVAPDEAAMYVLQRQQIVEVDKDNAGSGYTAGKHDVNARDGSGSGMRVDIEVEGGKVTSAGISNFGSGYEIGEELKIVGGDSNARLRITTEDKVVQLLKDDILGDSGSKDEGLAGAAAVAVSPDGQFVYVAATAEGDTGQISVYRQIAADGTWLDRLTFFKSFDTQVFDAQGENPLVTLVVSPDLAGKNVYLSGPEGLQVYQRDFANGTLTSLQMLPVVSVADLEFREPTGKLGGAPEDDRVYAVAPETNELLVYARDDDGRLGKIGGEPEGEFVAGIIAQHGYDERLDDPRSVEVSTALEGSDGTLIPADRFVYVASAGNNSISVFDEFDGGNDSAVDGVLHHAQIVREGVDGARGLQGVQTLQLSPAIADSVLRFGADKVDSVNHTINTRSPHGLRTGQGVTFQVAAEAPSGATLDTDYFVRRIDANKFQLATTEAEARSGNKVVEITANADERFALHTSIPAGAYLYALGYDANAITVFERDLDPVSPTVGQLTFLQVIRNRIGNADGGANFGLFQPDSIVAPSGDTSTVFVGSAFDPLLLEAPGGFVSLHNNTDDSPVLPPMEVTLAFGNMAALNVVTGPGDDNMTVHAAPNSGGTGETTTTHNAIPLSVQTGDGFDSLTLNDVAANTTAFLGDGEDTFTLRSTDRAVPVGSALTVDVDTGAGSDTIIVESVGANTTVVIDSNTSPGDDIQVDVSGIDSTSTVTIDVSADDTVRVKQAKNDDTQKDEDAVFQIVGSGKLNLTSNSDEPDYDLSKIIFGKPVTAVATASPLSEADEVFTLDASGSGWAEALPGNELVIEYAWDMNGDGLFTELVSDQAVIPLAWDDVVDFGFADGDVIGSTEKRLPLRVTRVEQSIADGTEVSRESSYDEITVTVQDVLPTLTVDGDGETAMRLGGDPYTLTLSATDPGGDQIVNWTVNWGDGTDEDTFGSDPFPTHFYQKPGTYDIAVTAVDDDGNDVGPVSRSVNVVFSADAVSAGGYYIIDEGQGVTLSGQAFGMPDADVYRWSLLTTDERIAGTGRTLELTWEDLNNLGVSNDGAFEVALSVTYNDGADTVTSRATTLTVQNVAPTAAFTSNGPVDQGDGAAVSFTNITDPVDSVFTYEYDFGNGFVAGSAVQDVPASVTSFAGSHVITGRVHDGTDFNEYQTTLVVRDLPPVVQVDNDRSLLIVNEGSEASLGGTFVNPGGEVFAEFSASIGTITADDSGAGRWTWTYTPDDGPTDTRQVTISAIDGDGTQTGVDFDLRVSNVAPLAASFTGPANTINEGGKLDGTPATMSFGEVTDPSTDDLDAGFSYSYDFGDGNDFVAGAQTQALPNSVVADNGTVTVRGRITDKDGGSRDYLTVVNVDNVAPTITSLDVTPQINEAGTVTLTGIYTDPGVEDTHTLEIDWGDGTTSRNEVEAGVFSAQHTYLDDALSATPSGADDFAINVKLLDDDDGFDERRVITRVTNVAPTLDELGFEGLGLAGTVNEGSTVTLTGNFDDVGTLDSHTVVIDWGDGETETVRVAGGRHVVAFEAGADGEALTAGEALSSQFAGPGGFTVSTGAGTEAVVFDSSNPAPPQAQVTSGGSGYATDTAVTGGSGSGLRVDIAAVDANGAIVNFVVTEAGDGYLDGDVVAVLDGNGDAALRRISGNFVLEDAGSGYATDTGTSGGSGSGLRVDITEVDANGVIAAFAITDAGSGYAAGDVITVDGGSGNATLLIGTDGSGASAAFFAGGSGYPVGQGVSVTGGSGSGMIVDITAVDGKGAVTAFAISAPGSDYRDGDVLTVAKDLGVTGGSGSGLSVQITEVEDAGAIVDFVIVKRGSGYIAGEEVAVSGGDGRARLTIGEDGLPIAPQAPIGSGYQVGSGTSATLKLLDAGELDLGTPNADFGGPGIGPEGGQDQLGENAEALGKVLRVFADNEAGGQMIVDFDQLVRVDSIDIVNVDAVGGEARLYDVGGELIATTAIPLSGNNSVQRVFLSQLGGNGEEPAFVPASRMVIDLANDSALARIDYTDLVADSAFAIRPL
jgi:hypothetical protein